jgi:hypothetical protein
MMKEIETILKELETYKGGVSFKLEIRYNAKTKKFSAEISNIIDSEHPPTTNMLLPSVEFVHDTLQSGLIEALAWLNERYHKYRKDLDE